MNRPAFIAGASPFLLHAALYNLTYRRDHARAKRQVIRENITAFDRSAEKLEVDAPVKNRQHISRSMIASQSTLASLHAYERKARTETRRRRWKLRCSVVFPRVLRSPPTNQSAFVTHCERNNTLQVSSMKST